MCGRVIQSSAPLRYSIVEGMDVRDGRVHNYPPRWNGAPSQDLLVIRRNRQTGEVSLDPLRWATPRADASRSTLSVRRCARYQPFAMPMRDDAASFRLMASS